MNEIKHSDTEKAFEKFRLVIQTYNDQNKILVLIQSSIITCQSTIDHLSSRLIISNEAISKKHYLSVCAISHVTKSKFLRSITFEIDQIDKNFSRLHFKDDKIFIRRIESRQSLI